MHVAVHNSSNLLLYCKSDKEILDLLKKAGLKKLLTKEKTSGSDDRKGRKKKKIVRLAISLMKKIVVK